MPPSAPHWLRSRNSSVTKHNRRRIAGAKLVTPRQGRLWIGCARPASILGEFATATPLARRLSACSTALPTRPCFCRVLGCLVFRLAVAACIIADLRSRDRLAFGAKEASQRASATSGRPAHITKPDPSTVIGDATANRYAPESLFLLIDSFSV
ncbi:hypothetical protein BGZ61DRAFT_34778 [Ilyonectria robusta]|uniref:uncharacterized protein n=1 Tax=Ilyonectria robusta TaxID=1079257 RepID=UPI001E8E1A3E|nr:uncharacterized protein BGZ61DRAFT_34778 [Ilyonectria robusta]KAH8694707.1 hypothetical protein BGZ61DRAFT_34778 [Ilyonectria robusta]